MKFLAKSNTEKHIINADSIDDARTKVINSLDMSQEWNIDRYDTNSIVNQDIKAKFVGREVYAQCNSMVEYILNKGFEDSNAPFTIEDVENYYSYNVEYEHDGELKTFNGTEDEKYDLIQALKDERSDLNDENPDKAEELNTAIQKLEDAENEAQEVFEWWIVSDWLCQHLKAKGAPVIDGYPNIWGRTTTGQAILLDGIISEICFDMEILEGQPNEWKA